MKIKLFLLFVVASSMLTTLYCQSEMQWVYLTNGTSNGSCTSTSDCDADVLCFGLEYTPTITGTLTSYTTGFFIDCTANNNGNGNPIISNTSCIMTDNSASNVQCSAASLVLVNSSGNSGVTNITAGNTIMLHQICLDLSAGQAVNIEEDHSTNLSVSIDASSGPTDELPDYSTFQASHNSVCSALAVELLSFNAVKKDDWSSLSWVTSMESNNDFFSVEWSKDGHYFQEISKIKGAGTSNKQNTYGFEHTEPANGINYYRLKAVEFDGNFEYSAVRSVRFSSLDNSSILLFPNPTKGDLFVNLPQEVNNGHFHLEIRSINGQLLFELDDNNNGSLLTIPLKNLPPATYLLILESNQERYVERFNII